MMKIGKQVIRNYMTLDYKFTGIRLQAGNLVPVDWEMSVNLIAHGKKGKSVEQMEHNSGVAYQKLYFWLDTNLPNVIVLDVNDEDDLYIASMSSNITLYCPSTPTDNLIIKLLHSKLSALSGENLIIGEIRLKGSDTSLKYIFDCTDGDYMLPESSSEYCPEDTTARDNEPWWTRDDGFCFDFIRPNDTDVTSEEFFADIIDPMQEFDRLIAEMADDHAGFTKEPARIVQIEKWKPKTVE